MLCLSGNAAPLIIQNDMNGNGDPQKQIAPDGEKKIIIRIRRQDGPTAAPRWEEFAVPPSPADERHLLPPVHRRQSDHYFRPANHPASLGQRLPSRKSAAPAPMVINGKSPPELLGPGGKIRRAGQPDHPRAHEQIPPGPRPLRQIASGSSTTSKKTKCWVPIDGTYDLGPGPPIPQNCRTSATRSRAASVAAAASRPARSTRPPIKFIGAAVISQVRLFNDHPIGASDEKERLEILMGEGGVADCGKAGNCNEVCPRTSPCWNRSRPCSGRKPSYAIKKFFGR